MDKDRIKEILLDTAPCKEDFTVILTGKSNSTANAVYKHESRQIVIYDGNFKSDNEMVYTAIHEYAHHLHLERREGLPPGRFHTNEFWALFEELLTAAEAKGHYVNIFAAEPAFVELTQKIRSCCITENGRIMLEFGKLMIEAQRLCDSHKMRFEDYIDRTLAVPRTTAVAAVKAARYEIDPSIGWEGMKMASGIKDPEKRSRAVESLKAGSSPAAVKANLSTKTTPPDDPAQRLKNERERLQKIIANLTGKLKTIEEKLADLAEKPESAEQSGGTEPAISAAMPVSAAVPDSPDADSPAPSRSSRAYSDEQEGFPRSDEAVSDPDDDGYGSLGDSGPF